MKLFSFKKLNTTGIAHYLLLALLVVGGVTGVGVYVIKSSDAAVKISKADCEIRGRTYIKADEPLDKNKKNQIVICQDKCQRSANQTAGRYITKKGIRGYCSNAIASVISREVCKNNGRVYIGDSGCARRWTRTQAKTVVQCANKAHTYWLGEPDYCADKKRLLKAYTGRDGFRGGQCTDYVKHVLVRHTPRYKGGTLGNGRDVARNLGRLGYHVDHKPAVRAVASFPGGNGLGDASAGHVGIVAEIRKDGSIVVEESNWSVPGGYGTHVVKKADVAKLTYAHTEVSWR